MPDEQTRLVYSSDGGRIAQRERPERKTPSARSPQRPIDPADGVVRIRRETSGRRGKAVTTVSGLPGRPADLDAVLKMLKQHCGTGGSRDGAILELQGDHRDRIRDRLIELGHQVKLAGG